MTIDKFMKNYNIKGKETIMKWISDELIPGANLADDFVPDSARHPYTKARAKTTDSIYYSIVEGTRQQFHVLPKLYNICLDEFNSYIDQLEKAGLIVRRTTDGIVYYDLTIEAVNYKRNVILDIIKACSEGITNGVTSAIIESQKSA